VHDERRSAARHNWLQRILTNPFEVQPLAGDASFRRYFRIFENQQSYVLMDAPPGHEDVRPFLAVRAWFERAGLRVSHLFAEDAQQGFLLLEDLGDVSWAGHCASGGDAGPLFTDALRQLHTLQASSAGFRLPCFDMARMRSECDLYLDWYLPKVAKLTPSQRQRSEFHAAMADSLTVLTALPQTPVHLDYHSRNLMLPQGRPPLGLIDYQDAVTGPATYDLASLLYDCYQDYAESERRKWSRYFFDGLPRALSAAFADFEDWHLKLRLTAWQRHIKAAGIFARLAYRDGKTQFLNEIPLTRKHLVDEMRALGMAKEDFPLLWANPVKSSDRV